jgi:hypothetical protein
MKTRIATLILLAQLSVSLCQATGLLQNGDFESGDLTGWTTFLTPNGDLGPGLPDATMFDTDGDGTATFAARFRAGEKVFNSSTGHTFQGGGLFQTFSGPAGVYNFSASIAAQNPSTSANDTAGVFSLFVDGTLRDSVDFKQLLGGGDIGPGQIERSSLFTSVTLTQGIHELRFQVTRNWLNGDTPYEYLDDVQIGGVIPEPTPSALMALAAVGFGLLRFLRRSKSRPATTC